MKINIGENYVITGNHGDYTIEIYGQKYDKKGKPEEGKKTIKKRVYFGKISQCIRYLLEEKLCEDDVSSLKEIKKRVDKFTKITEQLIEYQKK